MNITKSHRPTRQRPAALWNSISLPYMIISGLIICGLHEYRLLKYACQHSDHMLVKELCIKRNFKYSTLNDALQTADQRNNKIEELRQDEILMRYNHEVTTAFRKCLIAKNARKKKTKKAETESIQELTAKAVKQVRELEGMLVKAKNDHIMSLLGQTLIMFNSIVDREYKSMLERLTEITTGSRLKSVRRAFPTRSARRNLELSQFDVGTMERLNHCKQHLISETTRCLLNANRLACYRGCLATVQLLSNHFSERYTTNKEVLNELYSSWTLLSSTIVQTRITVFLLRANLLFSINEISSQGNTILHHAIWRQENQGKTPLHAAIDEFDVKKAGKVLFRDDERIDAQDNFGQTALHMACFYGHMELTRVLVSLWADPAITNDMAQLPSEIATERCHFSITDYLRANSM